MMVGREKKSWNRPISARKPFMKCEVTDEMITNPILSRAHSVHWYRSILSIRNNRELFYVGDAGET